MGTPGRGEGDQRLPPVWPRAHPAMTEARKFRNFMREVNQVSNPIISIDHEE